MLIIMGSLIQWLGEAALFSGFGGQRSGMNWSFHYAKAGVWKEEWLYSAKTAEPQEGDEKERCFRGRWAAPSSIQTELSGIGNRPRVSPH
jgi:hypothetical protein